jgi:hypothetical protein
MAETSSVPVPPSTLSLSTSLICTLRFNRQAEIFGSGGWTPGRSTLQNLFTQVDFVLLGVGAGMGNRHLNAKFSMQSIRALFTTQPDKPQASRTSREGLTSSWNCSKVFGLIMMVLNTGID